MAKKQTMQMRIALRVEGAMWNAYAAKPDSMDDAIWLGSIAMKFVENNERRKRAFIELMKDAFGEAIEHVTGVRPDFWDERTAPEQERIKE